MTPGSLNGAATRHPAGGPAPQLPQDPDATAPVRADAADLRQRPRHPPRRCRTSTPPSASAASPRRRLRDARPALHRLAVLDAAIGRPAGRVRAPPARRGAPPLTPTATYRHVAYLDGNAATPHPLRVCDVRLTVDRGGPASHADFTGSAAQVAAPLNAGPAIAPTSVLTVVKTFLDPRGPINSGTLVRRAGRDGAVPGTIVNACAARPPAAGSTRCASPATPR